MVNPRVIAGERTKKKKKKKKKLMIGQNNTTGRPIQWKKRSEQKNKRLANTMEIIRFP